MLKRDGGLTTRVDVVTSWKGTISSVELGTRVFCQMCNVVSDDAWFSCFTLDMALQLHGPYCFSCLSKLHDELFGEEDAGKTA